MRGVDPAVEALASVLDRHVTDAAFDAGCRLSCGYDGDDLTAHMARAVLSAVTNAEVPGVTLAADREPDGLRAAVEAIRTHNGTPVTAENLRWAATHESLCRSWIFDVLTGLAAIAAHPATDQPEVDRG